MTALVVALTFGMAVARAAASPQWRADEATVRDVGLAATGVGGTMSTLLTQAFGLLPLGPLSFRAAVGAAVALAAAAYLLLRATRVVAELVVAPDGLVAPWLRSIVSGIAAAAVALSPTWQQEGTVGGGGAVAAALLLLVLWLLVELGRPGRGVLTPAGSRGWILLAMTLGAVTAESPVVGLAALCVVASARLATRRPLPSRLRATVAGAFVSVLLALASLPLLRAAVPHGWVALSSVLAATDWSALELDGPRIDAAQAFIREIGHATLLLGLGGAVLGLWRAASRPLMASLVLLVLLYLAHPLAPAQALGVEPLVAVRMAALGAVGIAAAAGVIALLRFLLGLRVPLGRPAAALTVVFHATVVAVAVEEGAFVSDRSGPAAGERWTDEALGALPARAVLLVRSPIIAWRLWAARLLRSERPDLIIIPSSLVGAIPAVVHLLGAEPSTEPLLRDLALGSSASEFALSAVAASRPLYVELDPAWDHKVVSHLAVEGLWLRYAPQPLGRTDRVTPKQPMIAPSSPLARAIAEGTVGDDATARVLARTLKEHAATLSMLGLPADATAAVDRLEQFAADDSFVRGARLRLAYATHARQRDVELRDLLRF